MIAKDTIDRDLVIFGAYRPDGGPAIVTLKSIRADGTSQWAIEYEAATLRLALEKILARMRQQEEAEKRGT